MIATLDSLPRLASIAVGTTLVVALSLVSHAAPADTIVVWKVGSPHTGATPDTKVPFALGQEATSRGFRLSVDAFQAKGFAATFLDAVTRNAAPDVLVFDNMGVMTGITTRLGTFDGIGADPALRKELIRVTGAFDELLGPERGWTYLFALSANHRVALTLALKAPACPDGSSGLTLRGELTEMVPMIATAYLEGDAGVLQRYSDTDRLPPGESSRGPVRVGMVRPCGVWGNDKLAFASVNVSYESEATLGHTPVLLVLRKPSSHWQLLSAARDPISNGAFLKALPLIAGPLAKDEQTSTPGAAATLLSPAPGEFPRPSSGQRFGIFTWSSSLSDDVVAEVAEFAYKDDARLFIKRPSRPGSRGQVSAGELWTTGSLWNWRIWSISRGGDVVFSEARMFEH